MKETIVINSKILKTNDQKITAAKPLSTFLKLLDKTLFVRISQSYLVNSMHIVKIDKKECTVLLANGDTIPYTISIKQWVKSWLGSERAESHASRECEVCL